MGKRLDRHLTKEDIQMANKHMKRSSISFIIRELQIKTTVRYYCTHIRMTKIQNKCCIKCWWECRAQELLFIAGGTVKRYNLLWKTDWQFLIKLNIFLQYDPAITLQDIYPIDLKIWPHQNLHTNICIIFIHNSKNWKNQDILQ